MFVLYFYRFCFLFLTWDESPDDNGNDDQSYYLAAISRVETDFIQLFTVQVILFQNGGELFFRQFIISVFFFAISYEAGLLLDIERKDVSDVELLMNGPQINVVAVVCLIFFGVGQVCYFV